MSKIIKYTKEHIACVHKYINEDRMTKKDATAKAGFTDPSLYYVTLKRLGMTDYVTSEKPVSIT